MRSHRRVLQAMGVADLDTLVDPGFLAQLGLNQPGQYGIVCADVQAAIARLEAVGAGPFVYANTSGPNWVEYGETRHCRIEMAMGYSDHQQIELLGPGSGTGLYRDRIPCDGSMALHHVCIFQHGIAKLQRRLNASGFDTVVSGHAGINKLLTTRFMYFDTREELGFYLELAEYEVLGRHAPPGEGLISGIGKLQRWLRR